MREEERIYAESHVLSSDEIISKWKNVSFNALGFSESDPEYYSDNGERMRSKSEVIIANMLNKYNVPYRCEAELYLKGIGIVHPDFTILNVRLEKEVVWEHFGMMSDGNYSPKALKKIEAYEKNGYYPGENLIMTFEAEGYNLNFSLIEKKIKKYCI